MDAWPGATNRSKQRHIDDKLIVENYYEAPREDPARPEVFTYTDAMSYEAGDTVNFHSSCNAKTYRLIVERDDLSCERVHCSADLPGKFTPLHKSTYRDGCHWPQTYLWQIPADLASGFYRIVSECEQPGGATFRQYHFVVVRPGPDSKAREFMLILPTATWTSYNNWGGSNAYEGVDGPQGNEFSPILSMERPWSNGLVFLPEGAPRIATPPVVERGTIPRYDFNEWAYANGYSRYYAASGWAQYDRHFVRWAQREGYSLDVMTQTDLHYRPELLAKYRCVVIVGHDEYWTWEMREHMERFVREGGRLARFGGNFVWQIRLEDAGRRQVGYKFAEKDPLHGTDRQTRLTIPWEDKRINWPGATTVGLNGLRGCFARWGGFMPRGSGGFTVYRPKAWPFAGTDLYYGDVLGAGSGIFSYELDGLDYTFNNGLPFPTHADGAPSSVEILAMSPAAMEEEDHNNPGAFFYLRDYDLQLRTATIEGTLTPELMDKHRHGAGMIVTMRSGKGEVFCAGTCEWVLGLKRRDDLVEQVTRNVLDRFCR